MKLVKRGVASRSARHLMGLKCARQGGGGRLARLQVTARYVHQNDARSQIGACSLREKTRPPVIGTIARCAIVRAVHLLNVVVNLAPEPACQARHFRKAQTTRAQSPIEEQSMALHAGVAGASRTRRAVERAISCLALPTARRAPFARAFSLFVRRVARARANQALR